nr:FapA family protein [uncultured Butyrivibrio sp.]
MTGQDIDLINELNVYTGLDSFNSSVLEKELNRCGELGANVEKIKALGFNALQLTEIRKGLEDEKVDVNKYLNPKLSWVDMEEMRLEMTQGIDMSMYRQQGFDSQQLFQIRKGISEGIDVSIYAKKVYLSGQMRELRKGLEKGNDVPIIFFQDPAFDALQMREIRKGLQAGIDISGYAKIDISHMKMRAIRESAEDGLFFDEAEITRYTAAILNELHQAYLDKVEISSYVKRRYDADQIEQIRLSLKENIDIQRYISIEMRGDAIKEIRLGLEEGLDVGRYADAAYGWQQMYEMRTGLEHQIDISPYCKVLYRADQMREIRLGLEAGLDISKYSSMMYTARDMRRIRERLLSGDIQKASVESGIEGSVLDRTGGISDQTVLLSSMLSNRDDYVSISDNKMKCWMKLPARSDGIAYTEDIVLTFLFKIKVRYGLDKEQIKKMIASAEHELKFLVASGKEPVNGNDGYYEYFFDTERETAFSIDKDGGIDFSNVDLMQQIHVGDKIALYHKATRGTDGFNIFGEISKATNGKEIPILKGEGFMIMNDRVTYVAKYTGAISMDDGAVNIKKIMIVPEVRITDKKIVYDGVVYVKGDVNSGSEIKATGDIIIGGHMESSHVESNCNVIIAGGATCPIRGKILAGGNVTAKFFDGVEIEGKNISSNYFINCTIRARGFITTYGRQGMIYGGSAQSLEGIISASIGNKSGAKTLITLGVSGAILAEYNTLQKQISREAEELKTLAKEKERLQEFGGSVDRQTMQWKIKINAAVASKEIIIKRLLEQKSKMDGEIEKGSQAKATVTEMVYAGTTFIIDGLAYKVTEDRKTIDKIVFRTDAKKEKVIIL